VNRIGEANGQQSCGRQPSEPECTLHISLINTFFPAIGNTFTILTCGARTGQFSTVNGLSINSVERFVVTHGATSVNLTVESGP